MSSAQEIALNIFSKPPGAPKSVAFTVDEDMDMREVFEMLLMIFTEGMKILFGNNEGKVDLNARTEKDFLKVQEYFKSLGFICNYTVYLPSQAAVMDFETRKYNKIHINEKTKLQYDNMKKPTKSKLIKLSYFRRDEQKLLPEDY
jgi:hypothetical protein